LNNIGNSGLCRSQTILLLAILFSSSERINTEELNEQFAIVHEMAVKVISKAIPADILLDLLMSSLKGLNDLQPSSANGACVILNGLIKTRGKELLPKIPQIVSGLLSSMETVSNEQTLNGTLHAIRSLAIHHQLPVIDRLLQTAVPHSSFVVKSLQTLARDENMSMTLIHRLIDIINNGQLYEEKIDAKTKKTLLVACHLPMSATCALGEIMQVDELEDIAKENFALFLPSLLLRVGTANGMSDSNMAADQISSTFKQFISLIKDEALQIIMSKNDNWKRLVINADYYKAIIDITSTIGRTHPEEMNEIYTFLLPYLKGNFLPQRIVSVTVFAQLVIYCKSDKNLLNLLINCLLSSLADPTIKLQSLIGLGNIVSLGEEEANQYATTILNALMSSIDDSNEVIAKEAMNGLAKLFAIVDDARISPILINICLRIKPAFEKENAEIRAASFHLFGALSRFGEGAARDPLYDQMHTNLPALMVHMEDDDATVKLACKEALRQLSPLFRSADVSSLLSSRLDPNRASLFQFNEFLNDISKLLVNNYPDRINYYAMTAIDYFKSPWNTVKCNAANFVGFLLGSLAIEKKKISNLNPGMISKALINLLKEKEPRVRRTAAEAMSLLYNF